MTNLYLPSSMFNDTVDVSSTCNKLHKLQMAVTANISYRGKSTPQNLPMEAEHIMPLKIDVFSQWFRNFPNGEKEFKKLFWCQMFIKCHVKLAG